jgi:hypothetical protein
MERAEIVRSMQLVLRRASVVIRAIAETADAAGTDTTALLVDSMDGKALKPPAPASRLEEPRTP